MAEFTLKDRYGNSKTFDKETIYVRGVDGELMPFTHGTGNPVLEPLSITENGTYTAPDGVDGYNPVTVDVPEPVLQEKTITENGEYTADDGYDGLGKVTVDVAGSGGFLETPLVSSGTFVATSATSAVTIPHNLGVIPDYVIVRADYVNTVGSVCYAIGFRSGFPVANFQQELACVRDEGLAVSTSTNGIDASFSSFMGTFGGATESIVKIGGSLIRLDTAVTYSWFAIRFTP